MTDHSPLRHLGGHLRAADGLRHLVINARALGYGNIQTMIGGESDYEPSDFTTEDVQEFKKMMYGMELYVHLPYVINPCESMSQRRGFYGHTYRSYCGLAQELGARAVVLHPGFKKDKTEAEALDLAVTWLNKYTDDWKLDILLETDAGSKNGSAIGSADFIERVIRKSERENIHMCLDTTHMYARGFDLWDKTVRDNVLDVYGKYIRLVHLNCPDLDVDLGSFRDRHNISFIHRPTWDHHDLIKSMMGAYPCILERRSLAIQEMDVKYIQSVLGQTTR